MRIASSARMGLILGASLTAAIAPANVLAAEYGGHIMGINGSAALGIDGSSALGIDGSSLLGIDGSSALGIDGSSALGIDGSSALGIDGSSALGIDGSSALGIDGSSVLGGPVSSVSMNEGTFTAMGQTVSAPRAVLTRLGVGDFVTVDGRISGAGMIDATAVHQTGVIYAAGGSEVFVVGIPTSVDYRLGVATIGGLQVDYTQSLAGSDMKEVGAVIAVIGTQPTLGGKMISSQVLDKTELFLQE